MKNFDYELGRLSGILEAFAMINTKCNHTYSFEIVNLHVASASQFAFQQYFLDIYPEAQIRFEASPLVDSTVYDSLKKWLFSYQKVAEIDEQMISSGSDLCYLDDPYQAFILSDIETQQSFIENFVEALSSLLMIQKVYQVHVKTDSWYECAWDDFIFEGQDGSVFLHLGVSD